MSSIEVRLNTEPALKAFGGATGVDLDDAALLVAAHDAVLVGRLVGVYALAAQRDGADAGRDHAGAGDRAGRDVGIDERHFGGMDRAGDGGLDEGVPARVRSLGAGDEALHVLERGNGRKADPDAEADDDGRKKGTPVSARGKELPQVNSSKHRPSPGRNMTPWRATMVINLDAPLTEKTRQQCDGNAAYLRFLALCANGFSEARSTMRIGTPGISKASRRLFER